MGQGTRLGKACVLGMGLGTRLYSTGQDASKANKSTTFIYTIVRQINFQETLFNILL